MLSRTHTGNSGECGVRTLLGEAYRATPVGIGLDSSTDTQPPRAYSRRSSPTEGFLERRTQRRPSCRAYRHKLFYSWRLEFTAHDVTIFNLSI